MAQAGALERVIRAHRRAPHLHARLIASRANQAAGLHSRSLAPSCDRAGGRAGDANLPGPLKRKRNLGPYFDRSRRRPRGRARALRPTFESAIQLAPARASSHAVRHHRQELEISPAAPMGATGKLISIR